MIWSPREDWQGPRPELLTAYADGELDGPAKRHLKTQVEAWLATHPDAAAELAAHSQLPDLIRASRPAEPAEESWDLRLNQIKQAIHTKGRGLHRRRLLLRGLAGLLGAAAVVWLAVTLLRVADNTKPQPQGRSGETARHISFPVATEDEIEILVVHGEDTSTLVVGRPPLEEPVVLAGPGDVTVTRVQPMGKENMVPDVRVEGSTIPMIWARLEGEQE
jgi:anti-sigma factor RsiW